MYPVPPDLATEVFAKVPKHLEITNRRSDWLEGRLHGAVTSFLEGPSFDRESNLYCVDIPYGRILRVSPGGEFSAIAEYDGEPNGLKIHKDGRIFVADQKNGIVIVDPVAGTVKPFLPRVNLERLKGPNDLVFASNGDLYFTDQGQSGWQDPTGRVICVRANGNVEVLLTGIPSPNGIVFSPDESVIYLAVTRANAVWRIPRPRSGGTTKVGTFIQMSGGGGPDGLAVDIDGNLAVAHPGMGAWLFDRYGEPLLRIRSCTTGRSTTNLAYGGENRQWLYMTESATGTIIRAKLPTPGQPMYSHM